MPVLCLQLKFGLPDEEINYLQHCARIRDVSVNRLVREMLKEICKDQLCEAILDDGSHKRFRNQSYKKYGAKEYPL